MAKPLGVLSVHLEGAACRVGCEFCYLGARSDGDGARLDLALVEEALAQLEFEELAVAVSEPAGGARPALERLSRAVHERGRRFTVTTTLAVAAEPGLLQGVDRVNLSIDPQKGTVDPARVARLAARLRPSEVVLVVSLTTPEFAARLCHPPPLGDGLLEALVDLPAVDKVALNALKPPPPWCDRAFFMRALSSLRPLLARTLDTRLFLDCWLAARLLNLGGCPARPDLSPAAQGVQFRSCVYQAAPDFIAPDAATLAARLAGFRAPAECPFPYDKGITKNP